MKLFFCTPTDSRGASSRYRALQYLPYFDLPNSIEKFYFLDDKTYSLFKSNKILRVCIRLIFLFFKPLKLIIKVKRNDVVFVHRDIYPFGNFWIERLLKYKGAKIIFDLDDAIFSEEVDEISNRKNRFLYKLKYGKRYNKIIRIADEVICGNSYLANYCYNYNKNITVIPTVIDLNKIKISKNTKVDKNEIIFGWIGNPGNSAYFNKILPIFDEIADTLIDKKIIFRSIGGRINYIPKSSNFTLEEVSWSEETEYLELSKINVGIMPLENSEWSKGKCGLKILQYMSVSKPTIADAVGVNSIIIEDGKDGFLAENLNDWKKYIEYTIEIDPKELEHMGNLAKEKLESEYSIQSQFSNFERVICRHL